MPVNCQTVLRLSYKLVIKSLGHSNENFQGQKLAIADRTLEEMERKGKQ